MKIFNKKNQNKNFHNINLRPHYLYGPYENVNFMVISVYLLRQEWRKQKTSDSSFNYYCKRKNQAEDLSKKIHKFIFGTTP